VEADKFFPSSNSAQKADQNMSEMDYTTFESVRYKSLLNQAD